jgi:hypothetical protein
MKVRAAAAVLALLAAPGAGATIYNATPANYQSLLSSLVPGDTLNLAAGTYPLLNLNNRNGTAAARITIQGPASGAPAIIANNPSNVDCCNIVQLSNSSYVNIRNLTIDSQGRTAYRGEAGPQACASGRETIGLSRRSAPSSASRQRMHGAPAAAGPLGDIFVAPHAAHLQWRQWLREILTGGQL